MRASAINAAHATGAIRLLVVSSVLLYREGVAMGLARMGRFSVVGAVSGAEAVETISTVAADVILLDASSPESLLVARQLCAACPELPIVGFAISSEANSVACAEAGLMGFVGCDGTFFELERVVEQAIAGEVGCTPQLAAMLCRRIAALSGAPLQTPPPSLTPRERKIAELVCEGLSNKEIAVELRIGPATVKNHIHNILEKLQVRRRGAIGSRFNGRALETRNNPMYLPRIASDSIS